MDLDPIESYYDAVPRVAATTEEVGPFTLFVAEPGTGWQFYGRPRLGEQWFTADDVRRLVARQDELGLQRAVEWVDEVTPTLLPAAREVLGEAIDECPLLVLAGEVPLLPAAVPGPGVVRVLADDDPDLPLAVGAVHAGFGGHDDVRPQDVGRRRELIAAGLLVVAAAYDERGRLVGSGSAAPRGEAAELMGIATIPSARRRGHGARLTRALVAAVHDAGVRTVLLSSGSDESTRVYQALGFERVGTACMVG